MEKKLPDLIGLVGQAGSGKGEVARILQEDFGYIELSVSKPMKDFCRTIFEFPEEALFGPSPNRNKAYNGISPRIALQTLGDWGRALDPLCWIRRLNSFVDAQIATGNRVVISDIRFANEITALSKKAPNSEFWRMIRPGTKQVNNHATETQYIPNDYFDRIIQNTAGLEDLRIKVQGFFS